MVFGSAREPIGRMRIVFDQKSPVSNTVTSASSGSYTLQKFFASCIWIMTSSSLRSPPSRCRTQRCGSCFASDSAVRGVKYT